MQMLAAAGVPCVGDWPAFETEASLPGQFNPARFAQLRDCGVKLIDPANMGRIPTPYHVVIWLDREPREQARSALKLLNAFSSSVPIDRRAVRGIEASLRSSRSANRYAVGIPSIPTLTLSFEDLIERTDRAVEALRIFLSTHGWHNLNFERMAAAVLPRRASCHPGMLEHVLLLSRRPEAGL